MIIQVFFSNFMMFPCMELFFLIFQVSMISRACGNPDISTIKLPISGPLLQTDLYAFK